MALTTLLSKIFKVTQEIGPNFSFRFNQICCRFLSYLRLQNQSETRHKELRLDYNWFLINKQKSIPLSIKKKKNLLHERVEMKWHCRLPETDSKRFGWKKFLVLHILYMLFENIKARGSLWLKKYQSLC